MKTQITLIAALSACFAMCQELDPFGSWGNGLPLLAGICDVIGIGELESQNETNAVINVSQYWFGNPQTNKLDVLLWREAFPAGGTNFVFFLSEYLGTGNVEPTFLRFMYMFKMEGLRKKFPPDSELYLLGGNRSWIPVTDENAAMIIWCSNLVQVSQVNTNLMAFYELIRDGHRLNPPASRMNLDSVYAFRHSGYYMSTNFMQQVWSDTNLTLKARAGLNMEYEEKTGVFMPWPSSNGGQ